MLLCCTEQPFHDGSRCAESRAVLVLLREGHLVGDIGEVDEVARGAGTVDVPAVEVVIDVVGVAHPADGRTFGEDAREGARLRVGVRTFGIPGKGYAQAAVCLAVVLRHKHIVPVAPFHDEAVDAAVARIIEKAG